ncbi:MAG: aromatic amino acid lyase [Canibacter sp.]
MDHTLPARLTVHEIAAIAEGDSVSADPGAVTEIEEFHTVANAISAEQDVYGRSTGVGANRLTSTKTDPVTHGMNLLRSHAVDAGDPIDDKTVRGMLAVRLNQLLHPGSGIDRSLIDGLTQMLNLNALPEIRHYGSIGTADLPALAGTALALTGERPVSNTSFTPIAPISSDSALPFMSSNALTIAASARAASRLENLTIAALGVFALSALASRANPESFSTLAAKAVGSPTSQQNAHILSAIIDHASWTPVRIQDPFSFRGFLPSFSVLTNAVTRLREAIETLANLAQENPRFFSEPRVAIHHGAFLENWLAHELDSTAIALGQTAPQTLGRIRFMNDDATSELPRFLAPHQGGASGTMIIEYVAASALGDIFSSTTPVSTHSAVLSCGVEEDATFASSALNDLNQAVEAFEIMLASELVVAVRAWRLSTDSFPSSVVALSELCDLTEALPKGLDDRDLREDIDIARGLLPDFIRVVSKYAEHR